jgi:hypothetical protein
MDHLSSSWEELDLTGILTGTDLDPHPTLLARTDGVLLLYPGRVHSISGEPESGKSWFALAGVAEALRAGDQCLFLDFEDSPSAIVGRLRALGVTDQQILAGLHYVRPMEALDEDGRVALDRILRQDPVLAVVDGVTEALGLFGLELSSNTDVTIFATSLTRVLARSGAAVLLVDHVAKNREGRNRYAIGAQAKLAGLDGAAYTLEVESPFGHGRVGRSHVAVAKDRPGHVREHADHSGHRIGTLEMTSHAGGAVTLSNIGTSSVPGAEWQPTVLMERLSRFRETCFSDVSKTVAIAGVPGKREYKLKALDQLIAKGYVATISGQRGATLCRSVQPFREAHDDD